MDTTMQALRAHEQHAPLGLQTVAVPQPGPDDVLIKVVAAGLTPGVVKMVKAGRSRVPSTVGHEAAGLVAAVGAKVTSVGVGDRVRLHPVLSCRDCHDCRSGHDHMCDSAAITGFAAFGSRTDLYEAYHDGAVAGFVRAPWWLVDRLPPAVSFEVGAKVHDMATATRALRMARLREGSTIVLTAATGSMGALSLRLAHIFGIAKVILVGRSRERLESVGRLTSIPTEVLATADDQAEPGGLASALARLAPRGVDAIIDYLPSGSLVTDMLPALKTGGTLVHFGGNPSPPQIPLVTMMVKCWTVCGGRANSREDARDCLQWIESGRLEVADLITHRFPLGEFGRMLHLMETREEHMWLAVITMDG